MSNVILKRGRAKPFFYGHPWVFSGSVARVEGQPADGDLVTVLDDRGNFVARGFFNSRSQIRVRLATWNPEEDVDESYFERRIRLAVALREGTLGLWAPDSLALSRERAMLGPIPQPPLRRPTSVAGDDSAETGYREGSALSRERAQAPASPHTDAYRLVYSEGDGLPGLIVDRYADWLVVQFLSLGLALRKAEILAALARVCPSRDIFERSDTDVADKEGIEPRVGPLAGPEPPELVPITMHGIRLLVDLRRGQKTGLFLDHRDNYRAILPFAQGRRVLDCFAYTGAFALFARVLGGAASVLAIELSEPALALARRNAEANGAADIEFRQGDVFAELRRLRAENQSFGLVILDPPKFARSAADVPNALRGYKDINLIAMQLLEPGGVLVTCSCSQHVDDAMFVAMLNDAAFDVGREVQVLERRSQAADHPVSVTCPESRYLKCYLCRVL